MDENVELLIRKTLLNIYQNYIPNKKIKCDYCQPPWVNDNVWKSLKERSKFIKLFYKNGQSILVVKVTMKKYWEKLLDVLMRLLNLKKSYILKMSKNLEDSHTASKTYWNISDHSICNKKTPAIPLLFVYCNFISDFREKINILNNCFASTFTPRKNASLLFSYKTITRRIFLRLLKRIYYQ